jgi:hypothetical protein
MAAANRAAADTTGTASERPEEALYAQQLREGIDPGTIAFYNKGYGGGYGGGYSGGSYEGSASATPGGRAGGSGLGYDPNSPGGFGIGGMLYGWQNALQQGGTVPGITGHLPTIINGIPVEWTGDSGVGGGGSDAGGGGSTPGSWSAGTFGPTQGVFGQEDARGIPIGYQPVDPSYQPDRSNQPDAFNASVNTNYGYNRSSQDLQSYEQPTTFSDRFADFTNTTTYPGMAPNSGIVGNPDAFTWDPSAFSYGYGNQAGFSLDPGAIGMMGANAFGGYADDTGGTMSGGNY